MRRILALIMGGIAVFGLAYLAYVFILLVLAIGLTILLIAAAGFIGMNSRDAMSLIFGCLALLAVAGLLATFFRAMINPFK